MFGSDMPLSAPRPSTGPYESTCVQTPQTARGGSSWGLRAMCDLFYGLRWEPWLRLRDVEMRLRCSVLLLNLTLQSDEEGRISRWRKSYL